MADTMNSPWLNPDAGNKHFAISIALGLLLELAALGVLLPVMAHKEMPALTPSVVKLSIVAPPPKPAPPPPVPVPPKPVVRPVVKPLPPPPKPSVRHIVRHIPVPKQFPPPPQVVQPPPVPQPPQPPAPPQPSQGDVNMFAAEVRAALQGNVNSTYPQAAQMAHETGSVEVTFTYLNGVVTNIAITRSSGFPLLDAAALEDTRKTQYPAPLPGLAGRTYQITVPIGYQLQATSVDGD